MNKTLLLAVILMINQFLSAQIVYTDVNPDVTLVSANDDTYSIDMDNDGTIDLILFSSSQDTTIQGFATTLTGVAISTLGNTEIIADTMKIGNEKLILADSIKHGTLIDVNADYYRSSDPSVYPGIGLGINSNSIFGSSDLGNFVNVGPKFFGVKFEISGSVHYGWVSVSVAAGGTSGVVYEYAYESTADLGIVAGQKSTSEFVGVREEINDFDMYCINKQIRFIGDNLKGVMTVTNLLGKQIYQDEVNDHSIIDMSSVPSGIYLVSYSSKGSRLTKKIMVQ